ncbi:tyrosine--tRNA ligase [Nitrospirillum sp. BR 11828]|uniref:tyrosine--tRNA ligase n=1 Tax=Nitrospirillum sp. BR 11828 TaxID=3104325 RepID=UPI002ACA1E01|nr:tyrosine--tRNA ligase [Nitrospirillum sp. BR 11828]MDZ5650166.1 tyrosine--tRNA ligase [Nitrospirillum sp. BR 11828]
MDTLDLPQHTLHSTALQVLRARGYIHQCTDLGGLDAAFAAGVVPVYIGFDATADSLHVGHLLPIMTLRRLQRAGHKPIVLMGGGTTRVGDPSFRATERPLLSDDQIAANIQGIRRVFERFLTFGNGPIDAVMVNNADWLDRLGYIDLLRDVGRHFSVNRMLSFDSVKARLDRQDPMTFLEFNYMILQAFDFLELHRRAGCLAQMGGSDQWGNIVNGIDLVRRVEGREVFGLTTPLLTTASGAKMGKTAGGAVWLNADRLSPYDYWQFWRNTDDADVGRFLRLFTDLPLDRIAKLEALPGAAINQAKVALADAATTLAHGADAAQAARDTAGQAFAGAVADGLPDVTLTAVEVRDGGALVVDLLVRAGLAASKGEARRLIVGGGVRTDGTVVTDTDARISQAATPVRLSLGRKRHVRVCGV